LACWFNRFNGSLLLQRQRKNAVEKMKFAALAATATLCIASQHRLLTPLHHIRAIRWCDQVKKKKLRMNFSKKQQGIASHRG
jgi:aryl carrier-like protein